MSDEEWFLEPEDYTCYVCAWMPWFKVEGCPWVWDLYNTHGDCLAEK